MDAQPPEDQSALMQMMAAMQADILRINAVLADVQTHLNHQLPELTREQYTVYNESVKPKYIYTDTDIDMPATQEIPLKPPRPNLLKPGKKPQTKYKHHCKICDGEWIGDEPNPPACNYCRSRIWKSGQTKWHLRRKSQDSPPLTDISTIGYSEEDLLRNQRQDQTQAAQIQEEHRGRDKDDPPLIPEGTKLTCVRCEYTWTPHARRPKKCPKCEAPWWIPPKWRWHQTQTQSQ